MSPSNNAECKGNISLYEQNTRYLNIAGRMKRQNPQASVPSFRAGMPGGWSSISAPKRLLQDGVFERFRRAQTHHGLGLDLNGFACSRIAAHARLAMRLDRAADAGNHKLARALGFFYSQLEQFVEESNRLFLGDRFLRGAYLIGDIRNNLGLAQRICHRVTFSSSD